MTDRISVRRTTENAETVRRSRELAWVGSLLIVVSPAGYILALASQRHPFNLFESAVFLALPIVVLVRLIVVAIQLGRNLEDHNYLATMTSWSHPLLYLAARLLGSAKSTE